VRCEMGVIPSPQRLTACPLTLSRSRKPSPLVLMGGWRNVAGHADPKKRWPFAAKCLDAHGPSARTRHRPGDGSPAGDACTAHRYVVHAPLPGMPRRRAGVLFTRKKVAVFLDGCFWHGCPLHGTYPQNNAEWWLSKIETNIARDLDTDRRLTAAGWSWSVSGNTSRSTSGSTVSRGH